jgi:hypothetical protein
MWVLGREITIPHAEEADLEKWPFSADPGANLRLLIQREDPEHRSWITLYDNRRAAVNYQKDRAQLHGLRQQEFRYVFSVIVKQETKRRFLTGMKRIRKIDGLVWEPPENTDGPFLFESYWRDSWPSPKWQEDTWGSPKGIPVAFPACSYRWESSLDASLPRGASALIPSPWLISELRLSASPFDGSIYNDASGKSRFIGSYLPDGSSALIDAEFFQAYLDRNSLECVWLFIAERGAWPGGGMRAAWRQSAGICWLESGKPRTVTWYEDRSN